MSFVWYVIFKYFLPISGLSFYSLNCVLCRAEVLNFDKVQFVIFYFVDILCVLFEKSLINHKSWRFFLCSLLRILRITFRRRIPFELVFIHVRCKSRFLVFAYEGPVFPTPFVEKLFFLHWNAIRVGLFLEFIACCIGMYLSFHQYHTVFMTVALWHIIKLASMHMQKNKIGPLYKN